MKLSKTTLEILNNFSSINQSIKFSGNEIKTIAGDVSTNSIQAVAFAQIEETIDVEVSIYDLHSFLGLIKLYQDKDFDITFSDNWVELTANRKKTKFKYCNPDIIANVPGKAAFDDDEILCKFELTEEILSEIKKVSSVLNFEGFYLKSNKNKLEIQLYDVTSINNTPEHTINLDVKTTQDFEIYFELKNLYILFGNYDVLLTENMLYFKSKALDLEYYIVTSDEPI